MYQQYSRHTYTDIGRAERYGDDRRRRQPRIGKPNPRWLCEICVRELIRNARPRTNRKNREVRFQLWLGNRENAKTTNKKLKKQKPTATTVGRYHNIQYTYCRRRKKTQEVQLNLWRSHEYNIIIMMYKIIYYLYKNRMKKKKHCSDNRRKFDFNLPEWRDEPTRHTTTIHCSHGKHILYIHNILLYRYTRVILYIFQINLKI